MFNRYLNDIDSLIMNLVDQKFNEKKNDIQKGSANFLFRASKTDMFLHKIF